MYRFFLICLMISTLVVAACSPVLQVEPSTAYEPRPADLEAETSDRTWWQLRFKLAWPEGEDPDFSWHLLIAEQLLLPVIVQYQEQLPLWRFHRRAARTPPGHQFSLLFYSDSATASRIQQDIESNSLALRLIDNGVIEKTGLEQRSPDEMGRLELSSDPDWPLEIQRSWPYFIMGVSQAWLMQVQELSAERQLAGKVDYAELLEHYQVIDEELNAQWRENGQRAYLHHLNAVYGYQPIMIRSTGLRSF